MCTCNYFSLSFVCSFLSNRNKLSEKWIFDLNKARNYRAYLRWIKFIVLLLYLENYIFCFNSRMCWCEWVLSVCVRFVFPFPFCVCQSFWAKQIYGLRIYLLSLSTHRKKVETTTISGSLSISLLWVSLFY